MGVVKLSWIYSVSECEVSDWRHGNMVTNDKRHDDDGSNMTRDFWVAPASCLLQPEPPTVETETEARVQYSTVQYRTEYSNAESVNDSLHPPALYISHNSSE